MPTFLLRGKTEALNQVQLNNIRLVADLGEFGSKTGVFSVLAKVYVDGAVAGVGAVGDYKVSVLIAKN